MRQLTRTPSGRGRSARATALVAVALLVALGACGTEEEDTGETVATAEEDRAVTEEPVEEEDRIDEQALEELPDEEPDPPDPVGVRIYLTRGEHLATAGREVTPPAVAEGALTELLAGPDEREAGLDMATSIPGGTELLDLDIADGEATVDLSGAFEEGGGSLAMQMRVAQVVFTLTQFDSVDEVSFRIDGDDVDAIGGEGIAAAGVDRRDFETVTPLILVESPTPGQSVRSPLTVTGISNTFEATVQYEVLGPDGGQVDRGFTTATAGSGTWGDFAVDVSFPSADGEMGTLIVFEEDMAPEETGSDGRVNVVEIPVRMQ